jgi:DNA polymerase-3 subunit epsilon
MGDLKLSRDLVFFDIESTGLNVVKDKIVQIALVKYPQDNSEPQELQMLINPMIPISPESIAIHGITPEMLETKPTFQQVGKQILDFIGDADLAGYNSDRFDVPMLIEEFFRIGIDFDIDQRNLIDVQKIFYKMEPRTLRAAYMRYCGKELIGAHDALADVRATVDVLFGQIEAYKGQDYESGDGEVIPNPITNQVDDIAKFLSDPSNIDVTNRLKVAPNGEIVFNFGKYIGQPAGKTLYNDRQYYHWIQEKDFSAQVKKLTKKILQDYEKKMKSA